MRSRYRIDLSLCSVLLCFSTYPPTLLSLLRLHIHPKRKKLPTLTVPTTYVYKYLAITKAHEHTHSQIYASCPHVSQSPIIKRFYTFRKLLKDNINKIIILFLNSRSANFYEVFGRISFPSVYAETFQAWMCSSILFIRCLLYTSRCV